MTLISTPAPYRLSSEKPKSCCYTIHVLTFRSDKNYILLRKKRNARLVKYSTSGDAENSRVCSLKPWVGVAAAIPTTQEGIFALRGLKR